MTYDFTRIGFFQFDNLVRSRVPFFLLHEPVDFAKIYGPVERTHLTARAFSVDFAKPLTDALAEMADRRIPAEFPIILLSEQGLHGFDWVEKLEQAGFRNACFVIGGWDSMCVEAAAL